MATPLSPVNIAEPEMEDEAASALKMRNSGAAWFLWIAGLSLVNAALVLFGSEIVFPLGLASTLIVDLLSADLAKTTSLVMVSHLIGAAIDFAIIGFYAFLGVKAGKGASWAFIVGGVCYTLDLLMMLVVQEWMGVGLHIWALLSIVSGFKANKKLVQLQQPLPTSPWSG